jgi:DNA mismatch repair protein MutL
MDGDWKKDVNINMEKIHLLDSQTSNQIAAGEVVERPASVIKELMENAIDAGANRIKIKIFGHDLEKMQITDNGCGMNPKDLLQCVKRHATSKIKSIEDLDSLGTMGFRGEALPAIAAVSQMTIISRSGDMNTAYETTVVDGQPAKPQEVGAPPGTTIIVDKLFYNTPARKKFLKSPSWELGQISDLVGRLAMAYPHISFDLEQDGKQILRTSGNGQINQAVLAVYGQEVLAHMVELQWMQNILVHGLVSLPQLFRSSRHHYTFFVNNRWIRSKELSAAVNEAYHTILPAKRYPIVVIYLQVAPDFVDVNVHPSKMEVKFKDAQMVQNIVRDAIREALLKKEKALPSLGQIHYTKEDKAQSKSGIRTEEKDLLRQDSVSDALLNKKPTQSANYSIKFHDKSPGSLHESLYSSVRFTDKKEDIPIDPQIQPLSESQAAASRQEDKRLDKKKDFHFSSLHPLGQVDGTYIVAAGDDCVYFIDQHAAHERILYEKIKAQARDMAVAVDQLAVPQTVELTHQEALWLTDDIIALTNMGFIIEHFGDNTFIIRGVPFWYQGSDAGLLMRAVIEKHGARKESLREEELFLLACKSAVKANQHLTAADISALLQELDKCQNPHTCPHGRPVIIKIGLDEIRRTFLRSNI